MWKKIGGIIGLVAIFALVIAAVQLIQSINTSNAQDVSNSTQIAVLQEQLNVQREMATLQASTSGSGPNATTVAERIAQLESTAVALATLQASSSTSPTKLSTVLYQEDFESSKAEDWVNLYDGKWSLWQDGISWVYGVRDLSPDIIPYTLYSKSLSWTDYALETQILFESGRLEQIWLNVRRSTSGPECTGYSIGGNRYGLAITRFDPIGACQAVTLATAPDYPLVSGRRYKIRIEVQGSEIRLYVDDALVLSAKDDTYPRGGVALSAYEVKWAYFDNIKVYSFDN